MPPPQTGQSRRDDVESVAYVLLFMLNGTLPWAGTLGNRAAATTSQSKEQRVFALKSSTPVAVLCAGAPPELAALVEYTRGLAYDATPDYAHMRALLQTAFDNAHYTWDFEYDWVVKRQVCMRQGGSLFLPSLNPLDDNTEQKKNNITHSVT